MLFNDEDIQITDELKRELLAGVKEGLMARLHDALSDPWHRFDEEEKAGTFFVFLDTEEDIKTTLTLAGLVDRTMETNENEAFHNALADEFERLARRLRGA